MTFPTGVVEMRKYSDEELKAMLAESREASKHSRKLGRVMEIVADHRLQQLKHFQAREQLAIWRRTHGYNRIADDDNSWALRPRPPSPEELTASLWKEMNALKEAISMSGRARPWQKTKEFLDGLEGDLPNEELAAIKRYVERRSREAAQVTVTPVSTVQHCIPCLPPPDIPSDVCVHMEKKEAGVMDPEQDQLEKPSAGTGLETPGQQCPVNGETGRTTADGYLLVGMGSNQGGDTSSPTERVDSRADRKITTASNTTLLRVRRRPNDKKTSSEENKQLDPGGKGEKPPPWNAAVMVLLFLFWGERWAVGCPLLLLRVFVYVCLSVCFV